MKKRRGSETYAAFARKLGITTSTLHRLEHRNQSPTLKLLEQILNRLKCDLKDVFGPQLPSPVLKETSKPESKPKPPIKGTKYPKKKRSPKRPKL